GDPTRQTQRDILRDLDSLINRSEQQQKQQQQQQQGGGGGGGADQQPQPGGGGGGRGRPRGGPAAPRPSHQPAHTRPRAARPAPRHPEGLGPAAGELGHAAPGQPRRRQQPRGRADQQGRASRAQGRPVQGVGPPARVVAGGDGRVFQPAALPAALRRPDKEV